MHGVNLGESWPYRVEIAVMKEMGWSYDDLRQAPFDMIDVILAEMNARNKWTAKKQEQG